ncbi:MAG: SGNH/GDSL hydrolase family protein, partial [Endomicrobiaceae bacterium]|nr:SGNH/GDSL hydrolase family protein [Endomicrobiaceae bacterium]
MVLLECGLRLAGWTVSSYQKYKNNKTLRNKSQYTIMCLGESTTAWQYPVQLQEILDKKYQNKFSVIDCGIAGTTLEYILDLLNNNINKYKPNIAICMMGINDNQIVYDSKNIK